MRKSHQRGVPCKALFGRLVTCLFLTLGASAVQAVSLTNSVIIPEKMMWEQDLSNVTSPTSSGLVYMDNGNDTYTYMGMDSVSMMVVEGESTPMWDYSWSLTADIDPFIAGSFTVTNTSSMMQTFDMTFSLPIPSFTDGYMTGELSGDYNNTGTLDTLNLNAWEGLIDGSSKMSFVGPCSGAAGCTDGPTLYTGLVGPTIGIHMNFALSAGDQVTFDTRFEVTPVPLPAAAWLFGSGLMGLVGMARRKKAA